MKHWQELLIAQIVGTVLGILSALGIITAMIWVILFVEFWLWPRL